MQFIPMVFECYWVVWTLVASLFVVGLYVILDSISSNKKSYKLSNNWTMPWWDVWNFYYQNYFNNLNSITKVFFQLSWKEWHILDIRMFFVLLSISYVLFIF
jgi:hypothetical protein